MNIAMMTNNYKPFTGGVPISVERLTNGLKERGHEVRIFAPEYEHMVWEEGVVRCRTFQRTLKNNMAIPDIRDDEIWQEFEDGGFDLIHVHQPMLMGNLALRLGRKYDIPVVFTYHTRYEEYLHYVPILEQCADTNILKTGLFKGLRTLLPHYMSAYMNRCSLVFVPSADMRAYVGEQCVQTPVRILPTGLSGESYVEDTRRSHQVRQMYGKGKKHLLCTVSRLDKEKNLYFMLRSVSLLKERMGDTFSVVIVGDGAEKEGLTAYAKELGLSDIVTFTGNVPNEQVKDYLFASDLFLFTSTSETQGIVLAEAMAAGLPPVAVRACGPSDIVRDGCNGYLTKEDAAAYAEQTAWLLTQDDMRRRLTEGALQTAKEYHMSLVAREAEQEYQMVLNERRERSYEFGKRKDRGVEPAFLRLFKAS